MVNIIKNKYALISFLCVWILISHSAVKGQNLTMGQLLEVKKKDLGHVEDYLTSKNWEFLEASDPSWDKLGSATFTYLKDNMSDRAQSFITFYYSDESSTTRLNIQVNNKYKYTEYVNAIKGFGCKMISSKVENGQIVKIYRGATTTFKITSGTVENMYNEDSASWVFLIVSNKDYDINWGDEE
jgi:hypothetical protein